MNQTTTTTRNYKSTLNLPKTEFPMKANLAQAEPLSLKRWEAMDLYERVTGERDAAGAEAFVFHDGPPYANGTIHLGHMLNKVLKDFVVRTRLLAGKQCRYVPGWDCHGLPIEHKVMTELVESGKIAKLNDLTEDHRRMAVRRECRKYAEKFVKLQATQMQRLLTLADYEHSYLTMAPEYEQAVLEVFARLVERGLVYRALKPVHWSVANQTALAEAELEYEEREDPSIYVDFEAADREAVARAFGLEELDQTPSFMIWTTTPWTLPANLAIAVHERFRYALALMDGNYTVIARELVEKVAKIGKAESVEIIAETDGAKLVGLRYRHPFVSSDVTVGGAAVPPVTWSIVAADYVTLDDGTGLVHTAPGHGAEDFHTGKRVGLPIYCPVRGDGTFDDTVPEWIGGLSIWDANEKIVEHLRASGHLFHAHRFTHSYPHDWRSRTPVIFRATEQWFVAVDHAFRLSSEPLEWPEMSLRDRARSAVGLNPNAKPANAEQRKFFDWYFTESAEYESAVAQDAAPIDFSDPEQIEAFKKKYAKADTWMSRIHSIKFIPEWGQNRLYGMLDSRPDWCLSRQRAWGLPIPAFQLADGSVFMTAATVRAVARAFAQRGSDAWFTDPPEKLLETCDPASDPDAPESLRSGLHAFTPSSLTKTHDIFDVWFESGTSWAAVLKQRGLGYPADLYLEGSDQHRGWFQLSLLPALGATGVPPFKALLTHGFIVDKDGRKMSKSVGNTIEVEDLLKSFGADVCRWWVSSVAFENDIKLDVQFFETAGESYRKVRNTLRFLLSNLYDFQGNKSTSPHPRGIHKSTELSTQHSELSSLPPISLDAYVLAKAAELQREVMAAYEGYDFRRAHQLLYGFCSDTLSAFYCAAVKDRLYCDRPDSPRRRCAQTVMWELVDVLCRLLAPLMPHTADEAYRALTRDPERTVHVETAREIDAPEIDLDWPRVLESLDLALKALEEAKSRGIENPLDAEVVLPDADGVLAKFSEDLADMLGVSRVQFDARARDVRVNDLRGEPRCERSWKRDGTVRQRADGGWLTDRDAAAVGVAG